MAEMKFNQVCECVNCGNEAEMLISCSLQENHANASPKEGHPEPVHPKIVDEGEGKSRGHAVCSHCGGEADIWLDV